jgi:diketogulonate reductase-like aldo/keto reductase
MMRKINRLPLSLMLSFTLAGLLLSCIVPPASSLGTTAPTSTTTTTTTTTTADHVIWNRRSVLQSVATAGLLLPTTTTNAATAQAAATAETSSSSSTATTIATLSDGVTSFPLASFGLQIYSDEKAYELTLLALQVGYRNFFASVLAGNQKGFSRAVRDSGIARPDLFICGSVVSNRVNGFPKAYTSTQDQRNMAAMAVGGIDYLDQIMLDYPGPDDASIQGQWSAFQAMHAQGLTKTLSVSNFSPSQLDAILLDSNSNNNKDEYKLKVKPVVNQLPYSVAYHPGNSVADNRQRGLLVQAWAPLGGSLGGRFNASTKGKCAAIGRKYKKSWAQVALRWIVQSGASFTTQSQNKNHFQQDLDIFDFELSPEDMAVLSALA